ncbi:ABC transporter ATP-binding protein [Dongshaea marina]|uniref:ABC transporter ATP-binding protein n=1 Tax=Dongshaea marina TaxID=2047966 RepID=UPI000D3EACA5|nr:ATP-binding cassette domain-containing protein [Dongshaea marina]
MEQQNEVIIRVEGLGTCFDDLWVHKNLDLEIRERRIIAIIGDSGCGKTTLIREILMLQQVTEGGIYLYGEQIAGIPLSELQIKKFTSHMGMMFQQGALFSSLTVLENVMFPLSEYTNFDNRHIENIAKLKLKMVGLSESSFAKMPAELSGGMLKRTALARTLALDPKIIFLDEPSAGLDPQGAYELDQLIKGLQESLDLTVIIITHDLDTIWGIVDEVVYLGQKRVLVHSSVEDAAKETRYKTLYDFFNGPRGKAAQCFQKHDSDPQEILHEQQ